MEKDREGSSFKVQRASGDRRAKADVPLGLQTHPLHRARVRLSWRAAEGGKQPYFISAADGAVLSIAGLWDEWRDLETGDAVLSCR